MTLQHIRMIFVGLTLVVLLTSVGCLFPGDDDDRDAACELPASSCEKIEDTIYTSCLLDPAPLCDETACAAYRDPDAFCTDPCETDDDCEDGECRVIMEPDGDKYCVPSRFL
jgi:hypothetical protein